MTIRTIAVLLTACAVAGRFGPATNKSDPKDGLTYVWIPPGVSDGLFRWGCRVLRHEKPAHQVHHHKGFCWADVVTQQAYQRVTGKNRPATRAPIFRRGTWIGTKRRLIAKHRGGCRPKRVDTRRGPVHGCALRNLDEIAWYDKNSGNQSQEVGQKSRTLRAVRYAGNTWQWVADWSGRTGRRRERSNRARRGTLKQPAAVPGAALPGSRARRTRLCRDTHLRQARHSVRGRGVSLDSPDLLQKMKRDWNDRAR